MWASGWNTRARWLTIGDTSLESLKIFAAQLDEHLDRTPAGFQEHAADWAED